MSEELTKEELDMLIRMIHFMILWESESVATIEQFLSLKVKLERIREEI